MLPKFTSEHSKYQKKFSGGGMPSDPPKQPLHQPPAAAITVRALEPPFLKCCICHCMYTHVHLSVHVILFMYMLYICTHVYVHIILLTCRWILLHMVMRVNAIFSVACLACLKITRRFVLVSSLIPRPSYPDFHSDQVYALYFYKFPKCSRTCKNI